MPPTLDAATVRAWCRLSLLALGRAREEIDAINVYPVADGDTGTNLYLTVESAAQAVEAVFDATGRRADRRRPGRADATPGPRGRTFAEAFRALAHGALIGARGNSGTILAQLLRGMNGSLDGGRARRRPAARAAGGRGLRLRGGRAAGGGHDAHRRHRRGRRGPRRGRRPRRGRTGRPRRRAGRAGRHPRATRRAAAGRRGRRGRPRPGGRARRAVRGGHRRTPGRPPALPPARAPPSGTPTTPPRGRPQDPAPYWTPTCAPTSRTRRAAGPRSR